MYNLKKYSYIPDTDKPIRIDKFLHLKLKDLNYSRQRVKELIEQGSVFVNKKKVTKPSIKVSDKDLIEISIGKRDEIEPEQGNLKIVYEDEYMVVIDKPKGLVTHPAPSCKETTLVNFILHKYPWMKELDDERPGIVHRLDKDTTGLMVIALEKKSQELLKELFLNRKVTKRYLAIVVGILEKKQGEIKVFIDRDDKTKIKMKVYGSRGRESITKYRVIYEFKDYNLSLIEAQILTGRTHQIRVHFSHIGHPVLGDKLYSNGKRVENKILNKLAKRQMLHAWKLSLTHPIYEENLSFISTVPKDFFRVVLYASKKRPMVVGVTGSVGSGKSTVCRLLAGDKYPLWSADKAVESLYGEGNAGYEMIKRTFGLEFVDEDRGVVDKKKLFAHMNMDRDFREEVEKIIHPLVFEDMKDFISRNKTKNMVILEIPLLVEAGWDKSLEDSIFDVIVGVFCSDMVRIKRLQQLRGWSQVQISGVDRWQLPQKEKLKRCNIIIDNSSTIEDTRIKVANLRGLLRKIRKKRLLSRVYQFDKLGITSFLK